LNGLPGARFNGANMLATSAFFLTPTGNLSCSVYVVLKRNTGDSSYLGWGNTGVGLAAFGTLTIGGSSGAGAYAGGNYYYVSAIPTNAATIVTLKKTPGAINTTSTAFYNGTNVATSGHSTTTPNVTHNPFSLGQWANYVSSRLNGYIHEVLVCTPASGTNDDRKVEGYLAHKWGLAGNLQATHPYKGAPP